LGSIPQDKLLHFIAGALIVALCSFIKGFAPYAWEAERVAGGKFAPRGGPKLAVVKG
jgi:hypothetical protein